MATLTKKLTLIFSDAVDNHNKVWYGELYDNDDVITRWGRVGYDLQSKTFPGAGEGFLLTKEREKLKKGYTAAKVVDGGNTGGKATTVAVSNLHEIAKKQLVKSSHPVLDKLIDRLVKSNVHKITSTTNITLNDTTGLFQTPLGVVTPDAITDARDLLVKALPSVKAGRYDANLDRVVSDYLRLIPQNIGMKFNVRNILPDVKAIQAQNDILDSLEASYQAISSGKAASKDAPKSDQPLEQVFQVDLDVETGPDAARLEKWYETSKKSMHGYDRVKIRNVFRVKIHEMANAYVSDNNKEVFHGTSEANCLSILKSGLKCSPPSTAAIAGKMWGNGIYGAINSSKSLGYTYGRWGQGGVGESGWLFICQFAMGKIHYPRGYGNCSRPPAGCDSVWATVANTGLHHDELIVYANNRVNITFLLECK
jgi:predicted DNA-binding WGR domain protein